MWVNVKFQDFVLDNKFIERHNIMPHNLHVTYMFFNNKYFKIIWILKIFLYQSIVDLQGCFHFRCTIKDSVIHTKIWKKFKTMK